MMNTIIGWIADNISILTISLTAVMAILTAVAAWAAWKAAKSTQVASECAIAYQFMKEYSSDVMLSDLRALIDFKREAERYGTEENRCNFEDYFRLMIRDETTEHDDHQRIKVNLVDQSRRRVSHFFRNIAELYEAGYVTDKFMKLFAAYDGVAVYLLIVEPLEKAINHTHCTKPFVLYRKYRSKESLRIIL